MKKKKKELLHPIEKKIKKFDLLSIFPDFKEQFIKYYKAHLDLKDIAKIFGIPHNVLAEYAEKVEISSELTKIVAERYCELKDTLHENALIGGRHGFPYVKLALELTKEFFDKEKIEKPQEINIKFTTNDEAMFEYERIIKKD